MRRKQKKVKIEASSPNMDDPPEQASNKIIVKKQKPNSNNSKKPENKATSEQNVPQSEKKIPEGKKLLFRIINGKFVYTNEPSSENQEDISSTDSAEEDLEDVSDNYIKEIKDKLLIYGTDFFKVFPEHTDVQRVYDYQFDKELSVTDTNNISCRNSALSTSKDDAEKHIGKLKETGSFSTNKASLKNPSLRKLNTKNKTLVQPIYENIDYEKCKTDPDTSFRKIILPNLQFNHPSRVNRGTSKDIVITPISVEKPKTKAKNTKKQTEPKTGHLRKINTTETKTLVQPIYENRDCDKSRTDPDISFRNIVVPNLHFNLRSRVNRGTSKDVEKTPVSDNKPKTEVKNKRRKSNVSSHETEPKTVHPAPANTWLQLYEKDKTVLRRTYSRSKTNLDIKDGEKNYENSLENKELAKNVPCSDSAPSTSDDSKYTKKSSSDKKQDNLKKKITFKEENSAESKKGQPTDESLKNAEAGNDSSSGTDLDTSQKRRKPFLYINRKEKLLFRRAYRRSKTNLDIKDGEKNSENSFENKGLAKNVPCSDSAPSTSDDSKYTKKSSSDKKQDNLSRHLKKESVKKKITFKEENSAESKKGQPTDESLKNAEAGNDSSSGTDPDTSHKRRKPFLYINRKEKLLFRRAYRRRKVNLKTWYAKLGGRVTMCDIRNSIRCTMMDPVTKLPLNGEVLEPVPSCRWSTNVVCGNGENMVMGQITGPKSRFYRTAIGVSDSGEWPIFDPSPNSADPEKNENVSYVNPEKHESLPYNPEKQENVPAASGNYSPIRRKKNKFSKNTRPKSSVKRENQSANVGEQTPHSASSDAKMKRVPPITPDSLKAANMREEAARSPECIRVRDMPIPTLSWVDSSELSLLMNCKEDIGITERNPTVFRRSVNLTSRMRAILFEWLMEVCEVYKLRRVTYYLAVDYIDRYLSHTDTIKKNHLQLLGISCLFIAAKVEEIYPPKLSELAYVTDGACTDTDMLEKELNVISTLRWDVAPMTVIGWLTLFLQLSCTTGNGIRVLVRNNEPDDDIIYPQFSPYQFSKACMILDLSSLDDGMLQFKYSVIAASIVYYIVSREKALFVSGYRWEDIQCCVEWLYPFAVVAYKNLSIKALPTPKETYPRGSALRCVNPNIVLDEAHILQTNVVDLKMLEEVYELISEIRRDFKNGVLKPATGWSASAQGQGYDSHAPLHLMDPPLLRIRRTEFRTSSYIQAAIRNNNRIYHNTTSDAPIVISSESDEIDDAVSSSAGITSLKQEACDSKNISQSSPFEEQDSSSLMTGSSPDLAAEQLVCFVDSNGTQDDEDKSSDSNADGDVQRVDFNEARLTDNIKKSPELKHTEDSDEIASENNQDEYDSDKLSSTSNSNQNLGEKRRRSDADDEDSDENSVSEDIQPRRKKSCYERNRPCGRMLASPACSGMYLQKGDPVPLTLKPNEPEPSMTAPDHPEVFPTRGSHLSMEAFAKVVPKRIPDYVVVDSQFIQTVKDGYYSVRKVTS